MNENLLTLIRKLPLDKQTMSAALPLLGRYGVAGALVLARGYLGPLAYRARGCTDAPPCGGNDPPPQPPKPAGEPNTTPPPPASDKAPPPPTAPPPPPPASDTTGTTGTTTTGTTTTGALSACDSAVLGLALTKLVFELGELALYNPALDPAGRQPEFKLDDHGHPPAMSVAHVLAAARFWQQRSAERDAEDRAKQAAAAPAVAQTPRALLQAARGERYAVTPRYSYVAPTTYRAPR
jgi:hypothetical protein